MQATFGPDMSGYRTWHHYATAQKASGNGTEQGFEERSYLCHWLGPRRPWAHGLNEMEKREAKRQSAFGQMR